MRELEVHRLAIPTFSYLQKCDINTSFSVPDLIPRVPVRIRRKVVYAVRRFGQGMIVTRHGARALPKKNHCQIGTYDFAKIELVKSKCRCQ